MKNITLLCVEDDNEALENIVYLLKKYFKKIYTATNGEIALSKYFDKKPDIILLDINIPKLNGLEVAAKIRENNETVPIIFLTAHSDKDKLLEAISLQVNSYIIKPFKIYELKESIFKVIEKLEVANKILLNNNFSWNIKSNRLFFKDKQLSITKNEIELIKLFILNRSIFLTTQDISQELGTKDMVVAGNSIVQLISRFKKKIEKQIYCDKFFIENIYGSGYRIC